MNRLCGVGARRWLAILALSVTVPAATLPEIAGAVVNRKLNATLADGAGDIGGVGRFVDQPFAISPDSRWVVYLANQASAGTHELWSVPIAGGDPVRRDPIKLNGPLVPGGNVSGASGDVDHAFRISPDSRHVVYIADQSEDEVFELWTVPIEGGTPRRLTPSLVGTEGDVRGTDIELESPFLISPDGRHVVYVADQAEDEVFELWSVPIEGGDSVRLHASWVDTASDLATSAVPFSISADSRRVVYVADAEADEVFELWSVPIGGGEATRLSGDMVAEGDVNVDLARPFTIGPRGHRVVYVADQARDQVFEIWSVKINGNGRVKLNETLAHGDGDIADSIENPYRISPDGRRVVYLADQAEDEVFELWSVPIEGGPSVRLNGALATARGAIQGDVRGADARVDHPFRISPDGRRVVYIADQAEDEVFELWSVPIEGGASTRLNPSFEGSPSDIRGPARRMHKPFRISPDSRRVVYLADQAIDSVFELWSVPIGGGESTRLNRPLDKNGGEVRGADNMVSDVFLFTADGRHLVYVADQEATGVMELFSVPSAGGEVSRVNPTLNDDKGAIVGADYELNRPFRVSPDGEWVVYVADQESDEVIELFSSRLFGPDVLGNGVVIVDGDLGPSTVDGTDFGVLEQPAIHRFTIRNRGRDPLLLGAEAVRVVDSDAFAVVEQPSRSVAPGDETRFAIRFAPVTSGAQRAKVEIAIGTGSDSGFDDPYVFVLRGRARR